MLNASAGMLQKQLYVYFTTPTDGLGPVMENVEEHLKFQIELEERGVMFGAGPFWADDEHTWNGEGMVIVRASEGRTTERALRPEGLSCRFMVVSFSRACRSRRARRKPQAAHR